MRCPHMEQLDRVARAYSSLRVLYLTSWADYVLALKAVYGVKQCEYMTRDSYSPPLLSNLYERIIKRARIGEHCRKANMLTAVLSKELRKVEHNLPILSRRLDIAQKSLIEQSSVNVSRMVRGQLALPKPCALAMRSEARQLDYGCRLKQKCTR